MLKVFPAPAEKSFIGRANGAGQSRKGNTMELETLIDRLNDQAQTEEESALSIEGNYGEFCASFGYGEASKSEVLKAVSESIKDLDEGEIVLARLKALDKKDLFSLLERHSIVETIGIYLTHDEIFSVSLGEIEFEIDEEARAEFEKLSAEEKETVRRGVDFYLDADGSLGYLDLNYNRMVMVLDADGLMGEMLPATVE
jgi:hypothetical protein